MTSIVKRLTVLALSLCLLMLPLTAAAEEGPIDLMPKDEAGYTIVEGDGTVTLGDDGMTIVNNTDGDLRIWINYATPFDMTVHNTVGMEFQAEMPFKMAFHLISDADTTDDWLTTSTDYLDQFELDTATDRSPAGEYVVAMNIGDLAKDIADKSSVHFDQFIILMTGKGTFKLTTVELDSYSESDLPGDIVDTDEPTEDTDESVDEDVLTIGATETDEVDDEEASFPWIPVIVGGVVLVAAIVVVIVVVKRK